MEDQEDTEEMVGEEVDETGTVEEEMVGWGLAEGMEEMWMEAKEDLEAMGEIEEE